MSNISQEYLLLFNAVTEAEELLRALREKLDEKNVYYMNPTLIS